MALPYFYQKNISATNNQLVLTEEASKHCVQVLRMKEGEQLQLTNGIGNLFTAEIIAANKRNTIVKILETSNTQHSTSIICIAISLLKNASRFEWFLEKATEIGITEIIPVISKRTERQHFRFDRMNNILIAAMLQSQQTYLPVLKEPVLFNEIFKSADYQTKLVAHCEEDKKQAIKDIAVNGKTQILIGPEGDFTPEEIALALQNNYQPVTLGNTRLRAETAGVVAAVLLANI
ncbi:MAG: RsmE family RNA methyltransferase [Chitinophagaceae bacterium]